MEADFRQQQTEHRQAWAYGRSLPRPWFIRLKPSCLNLILFVCAHHPRRPGCSWFISHTYTSVLLLLVKGTDSHPHIRAYTLNSSVLFCSAGSDEQARSFLPSPPRLLVIRVPLRQTGSICRLLSPDPALPPFLSLPLFHAIVLHYPWQWSDEIMNKLSSRNSQPKSQKVEWIGLFLKFLWGDSGAVWHTDVRWWWQPP